MFDPINQKELRAALLQHNIRPRKHWGQNFLVDENIRQRMLHAASIQPEDTVLEIGGGVGALSVELAKNAKRLVVIERDPSLYNILTKVLSPFDSAEVLCADARTFTPEVLGAQPYTLISNLPYSVGLPILRNILESAHAPRNCFVMLQKEVGERLCAQPPHMTLPAAAMQYLADIEKLFSIPASATWPVPDVDSVYLRITPKAVPSEEERGLFMKSIKQGFAHPRKKVLSNLSADKTLAERCAFDVNARAQELTISQWRCIAQT